MVNPEAGLPFRDPTLPFEERVRDLVGRLSVEEKVGQMLHAAKPIERLGIPEYNYWNECLHGVARAGRATVFPQAIGMAAAFDRDLLGRIATAISDEARAKHHEAAKNGNRGSYRGLTFWTPNINIFRDPRWGRGHETYGEDPHLTAELGVAFVRALQGDHPKYMKAAACAKHYAVHSGPEEARHRFDAKATPKDLAETYLPAFKALVEAGVESVMGAYNRTNGEPCCGSKMLLVDTLREKWGFRGHVVSDCWALQDFHMHHKVTTSFAESAALALKMGCDLNCGCTYQYLLESLQQALISEADIDRSVSRLLMTRMKLGLFDADTQIPFASIGPEVVDSDQHRALAREAAQKSIVLLKNEASILPLSRSVKQIFVTGPNAADVNVLLGNYFGVSSRLVTVLEGIAGKVGEQTTVTYKIGTQLATPNVNPKDWVSFEAASAEICIVVCGISPLLEGEEGDAVASDYVGDRKTLDLPKNQIDLLKQLHERGTNIVLVLTGGSPIDLREIEPLVKAILWVWYPGEEGGNAVADILFGDASPSGRLPVTFPRSLDDLPDYENYSMIGRTYRYMEREPMYPFGFGLSYTSFRYDALELEPLEAKPGQPVTAKVRLTNVGERTADEVVQIYLSHRRARLRVPCQQLVGFQRVRIEPGKSTDVSFTISPDMLAIVDDSGEHVYEPGECVISAGGASPGARSLACGAPEPAEAILVCS